MLKINWLAYSYDKFDGYGRYSRHLVRALQRIGVSVTPMLYDQVRLPGWLQRMAGNDFSRLTIACMPPYMMCPLPGRQWNLTMTEGTILPEHWADTVNAFSQRLIVPCDHNAAVFEDNGVTVEINVVHGGTDYVEFPVMQRQYDGSEPYTFLALADRGARKGWVEVWSAFYLAFGKPSETPNARLIIKTRCEIVSQNDLIDRIAGGCNDPRVSFWREDVQSMADVFDHVDCFAIPARSEGWGMPQREGAMAGLPVILTQHSGLDDGHTNAWALVVEKTKTERIPPQFPHCGGYWEKADIENLARKMRWCYEHPNEAADRGRRAAQWLRENQTWEHSAQALSALIEEYA